jgi:hypothetical protein
MSFDFDKALADVDAKPADAPAAPAKFDFDAALAEIEPPKAPEPPKKPTLQMTIAEAAKAALSNTAPVREGPRRGGVRSEVKPYVGKEDWRISSDEFGKTDPRRVDRKPVTLDQPQPTTAAEALNVGADAGQEQTPKMGVLDRPRAPGAPLDPQGFEYSPQAQERMAKERRASERQYADNPSLSYRIGQEIKDATKNPVARGVVTGVSELGKVGVGAVRLVADLTGADTVGKFAAGAANAADTIGTVAGQGLVGNEKLVADVTSSILNSLPSLALGVAGGPALKGLFVQSTLNEYNAGRDANFGVEESLARASIMGVAEALGERFGFPEQIAILKSVVKGMPQGDMAKAVGSMLMKEIPGEQLTTLMQFLADKVGPAALSPNATLAEYLEAAAHTLKVTIGQTAVMGGGPALLSETRQAQRKGDATSMTAGDRAAGALSREIDRNAGAWDRYFAGRDPVTGDKPPPGPRPPTQARADAIKRFDELAAAFGLDPDAAARVKEQAGAKPADEVPGFLSRVTEAFNRRGLFKKPVDDAGIEQLGGMLNAPDDEAPASGAKSGPSDPNAPGGAPADTGPMDAGSLLGTVEGDAPAAAAPVVPGAAGEELNRNWTAFAPESGTLGLPREQMPQIGAEHRGALVNFLAARGVERESDEVPADSLKPTQAEFSQKKVQAAKEFVGGDRSILVSEDGYILDGTHQWLAKLANSVGEPVKVIRLKAPIQDLLRLAHQFPSSTTAKGAPSASRKPDVPVPAPVAPEAGAPGAPEAGGSAGPVGSRPDAEPGSGVQAPAPAPAGRGPAPEPVGVPTGKPTPALSSPIHGEDEAAERRARMLAKRGKPADNAPAAPPATPAKIIESAPGGESVGAAPAPKDSIDTRLSKEFGLDRGLVANALFTGNVTEEQIRSLVDYHKGNAEALKADLEALGELPHSKNAQGYKSQKERQARAREHMAAPAVVNGPAVITEQDGKFYVRFGDDRAAHGPIKTRKEAEEYAARAAAESPPEIGTFAEKEAFLATLSDDDLRKLVKKLGQPTYGKGVSGARNLHEAAAKGFDLSKLKSAATGAKPKPTPNTGRAAGKVYPKTVWGSEMLGEINRKLGGISKRLQSELSFRKETGLKDKNGRPITVLFNPSGGENIGGLFRDGGIEDTIELAEWMETEGYITPGSVANDSKAAEERARELVTEALNRKEPERQTGQEEEWQRRLEASMGPEPEVSDQAIDRMNEAGYDGDTESERAMVDALLSLRADEIAQREAEALDNFWFSLAENEAQGERDAIQADAEAAARQPDAAAEGNAAREPPEGDRPGEGSSGAAEGADQDPGLNATRQRIHAHWMDKVHPVLLQFFATYRRFGVDRLERNRIKPEGMSGTDWLLKVQRQQPTWDRGRKIGTTGIEMLSQKGLWPTEQASEGENLRKDMLAAVRALRASLGSSADWIRAAEDGRNDPFQEAPALNLEVYDEAALRERAAREQAAADAEKERQAELAKRDAAAKRARDKKEADERAAKVLRERADAARDGFELGQEPPSTAINRDQLAGQGNVFDAPAEAEAPAAAPVAEGDRKGLEAETPAARPEAAAPTQAQRPDRIRQKPADDIGKRLAVLKALRDCLAA